MKKIRVSVYTRSHSISPSSYYRINQYVDKMFGEDFQIDKHYVISDKIYKWYLAISRENRWKYFISQGLLYLFMYLSVLKSLICDNFFSIPNTVIVLRDLIPRKASPLTCFLLTRLVKKSVLIWDFDDNIFESGEIDLKIADVLAKHADKVVVTSRFLREQLPQLPDERFIYLPTTDGDMYRHYGESVTVERRKRYQDELAIVWVATAVNLPFLQEAIPCLDEAAEILRLKGKRVVLEVVCNQDLLCETRALEIRNIRWTRDVAIERMLKAHIGIMPLVENEFTKGKGGFKLIQYMSVGLPVIASNVGYNAEVIYPGMKGGYLLQDFTEWTAAIVEMAADGDRLEEMGKFSRLAWEERFSFEKNYNVWMNLIKINTR